MLRFATDFALAHAPDVADWREHNLGVEGVLIHARMLHAFLAGSPGGSVPMWAPFGSAADCVPGYAPQGFLTDAELLGIAGALGRFGSGSPGYSVWNTASITTRALNACRALADALDPDDAELVLQVCSDAEVAVPRRHRTGDRGRRRARQRIAQRVPGGCSPSASSRRLVVGLLAAVARSGIVIVPASLLVVALFGPVTIDGWYQRRSNRKFAARPASRPRERVSRLAGGVAQRISC